MMILLYFDWVGSVAELKELNDRIKQFCERGDIKYRGLYGPLNQKWNYVWMFDTDTYEALLNMGRKIQKHPKMTHYVAEVLMSQNI